MKGLKLATFNLWKNCGDFPRRIESIPKSLRKNQFDIICFQEDFHAKSFCSSSFLNLELDYYCISTKTRRKFRNNEYSSSNLTILSKYKINLIEEYYFTKEQESQRACQFVEAELEDENVLLINTHLCHLSSKNRVEQIKIILEKIKEFSYETTFLCGDLNALPSYEEIRLLKEFGFKDKNKEFTHKDKVIIDYIFYKMKKTPKIKSQIILKEFSEHFCLLNKFSF